MHQLVVVPREQNTVFFSIMNVVRIVGAVFFLCALSYGILRSMYIDSRRFQVVFLKNGEVFFGKMINTDEKSVLLNRVYYLKHEQGAMLAKGGSELILNRDSLNNVHATSGKVQLVKQSTKSQGSSSGMKISKTDILFWENLREDSHIYRSIINYQ